jgi:hypothetical protein
MQVLSSLRTARILVIIGFLAGWNSLGATFAHIGDASTLLTATAVPTHSWHHFIRELGAQFAIMTAILLILFLPAAQRTRSLWWVVLILMLGFYGPFWIGLPFDRAYGAPSLSAELNHLSMAVPALLGALLARRHYPAAAVQGDADRYR